MKVGLVRRRFVARARLLWSTTDGLAITEYGLLVALVTLALVAVLAVFGPGIATWFGAKTGQITTV